MSSILNATTGACISGPCQSIEATQFFKIPFFITIGIVIFMICMGFLILHNKNEMEKQQLKLNKEKDINT